jgi:hypothetical protein
MATYTVWRGRITAWRHPDIWPPLAEIAAALDADLGLGTLGAGGSQAGHAGCEFHTLPGADYEQVLGELAKYGANMLLATQTLSRLDRLTDAQRTRNLRASVFSSLDGLFAFPHQRRGRHLASGPWAQYLSSR